MSTPTYYGSRHPTSQQSSPPKAPPDALAGSPSLVRDDFDPTLFVYYLDGEGRLQQRKHYRQVILRYIQPWRDKRFSYDHVDEVFDEAARKLRKAYQARSLAEGMTESFADGVFAGVAIEVVRKHGQGRNPGSEAAAIRPNPEVAAGASQPNDASCHET